jgi:hypothetical protein
MRKTCYVIFILSIISLQNVKAQDSLLAALKNEAASPGGKQFATFKSTRLINAQTSETTTAGSMDFKVSHRFGDFLSYQGNGEGGFHTFYGLDDPNFDIRIAFEYGITDRLMVGVSRSKQDENVEGLIKFRLLQQTMNNKIPVNITLFASAVYTPKIDSVLSTLPTSDRLTYTGQVIISRKFSSSLSLEIIPSLVHRNVIFNRFDDNDIYSIGGGGRWKLTKSFNLIADYFYNYRTAAVSGMYYPPLGAGVEIETGGHVFSLMFTNAQYIIEPEFIANTTQSWAQNGWKFCFNISRTFSFKKRKE